VSQSVRQGGGIDRAGIMMAEIELRLFR